jgi:hypothetical protein
LADLDARVHVPIARGGHALLATFEYALGPWARLAFGYRTCLSDSHQQMSSWIEVKAGYGTMDATFAGRCSDCQDLIAGPLVSVAFEQRF